MVYPLVLYLVPRYSQVKRLLAIASMMAPMITTTMVPLGIGRIQWLEYWAVVSANIDTFPATSQQLPLW